MRRGYVGVVRNSIYMSLKEKLNIETLPAHVAIIMDGNGRWARERGFDRVYGHYNGVISVREITEAAGELGLKYLTLYAFSTENWNRPDAEVAALMELLVETIEKETEQLNANNVRIRVIGDLNRLPEQSRLKFEQCMTTTADNTGLNLVLALSYSSRWEMTEAVRSIAQQVAAGTLLPDAITEEMISCNLNTKDIPDPDLLIRTSGETRISNFLLWQLAYSELYFTSINWPDFRKEELYAALYDYQQRERRYGKTSDQLNEQ